MRIISIFIGLLLFVTHVNAQNIQYGMALDTNMMLIGDQQHLTFQVLSDDTINIEFPTLKNGDSQLQNIEIIEGPILDTLAQPDNKILYTSKYLITAFDTGVYVIPQSSIVIKNNSYNNVLRTDSLLFGVVTLQTEKDKMYDIVKPLEMPLIFSEILPYLLWGLLILAVVSFVIWVIIRYKKNKPILHASSKPIIPPYTEAMNAFKELSKQNLWQDGRTKEYYTSLTDILRIYLNRELKILAIEQTSNEILHDLVHNKFVSEQNRQALREVLETADFVKFAKSTPLPDENAKSYDLAYKFVQSINEQIEKDRQVANQKVENEPAN